MSITSTESGDADRRAILDFVKQMMGPMYDPDKEDLYVGIVRYLRSNPPKMPEPEIKVPEETLLQKAMRFMPRNWRMAGFTSALNRRVESE